METKFRKGINEPSHLSGPPSFSVLSKMSLKSPVRAQASSLPWPIIEISSYKSALLSCCGVPYMKVIKNKFFLYVTLVSMKFAEEFSTVRFISFFHKRASPPLRPVGGTRKWCLYSSV